MKFYRGWAAFVLRFLIESSLLNVSTKKSISIHVTNTIIFVLAILLCWSSNKVLFLLLIFPSAVRHRRRWQWQRRELCWLGGTRGRTTRPSPCWVWLHFQSHHPSGGRNTYWLFWYLLPIQVSFKLSDLPFLLLICSIWGPLKTLKQLYSWLWIHLHQSQLCPYRSY